MVLEFEKEFLALESKIRELQNLTSDGSINLTSTLSKLQTEADKMLRGMYSSLTPWQKVLVARHPNRPQFSDYISELVENFVPLCGDRAFGEDRAIIGGLGRFRGRTLILIGQQKGKDTKSRIYHNFGMPRPEGYRKAQRLFKFAEQFGLPVITFIDTAGAYPGVDAEERGQAEAIARSIEVSLNLKVPIIALITGEGCSGGAVALGTGNYVLMLEHAIYSVISPEGCASILWRTSEKASDAAKAQKLTAQDLLKFNIIDQIINEPLGGAHRAPLVAIRTVANSLEAILKTFDEIPQNQLVEQRYQKFLNLSGKGLK